MSVMWGNSRHKQNIEPFPKSAYLQVFDHWWCLAHFGWQNFAGAKGFADQNMLDHTSQPRARWKWKFSRRKGASFFPVFSVIIFGSGPGPLFCMLVSVLGRIGQRDPRILGAAPCGPWRRVSVGITWGCNNICWHSISSASPHAGTSSPKKTVDVLPRSKGFAVLLRATALAVKNGSSQGLDREMRTNLCRGIHENWREKSKVDSAGCFGFLKDFPVEFIHLWRRFLDAQLKH